MSNSSVMLFIQLGCAIEDDLLHATRTGVLSSVVGIPDVIPTYRAMVLVFTMP